MARHVLKNDQVQFAGSFQLNTDAATAAKPAGPQPGSKPVRARIAETGPEFALVEVTCACGQVTFVRCEYAADAMPLPVGPGRG